MFIKKFKKHRRRPCKRHSLSTPNLIDYQMNEFLYLCQNTRILVKLRWRHKKKH